MRLADADTNIWFNICQSLLDYLSQAIGIAWQNLKIYDLAILSQDLR